MKFVVVVVSALLGGAVCRPAAEAEPQQLQNQQRLDSFSAQFAQNAAVAGAASAVPGRFSYEVNSVHPVPKPKQVNAFGVPAVERNEAELNAQVDLPAVEALPAVPAVRATFPFYDRYAAYTPYDAYSLLSSPYYNYLNGHYGASSYLPSTYGYLNPFAYNPFGLRFSGPSAEE